jgi:hypothetical protein
MSAGDVAIIIGASVQAASVILGLGRLQGCIKDIREDMHEMRTSIQSFLLAQSIISSRLPPADPPIPPSSSSQKGATIG